MCFILEKHAHTKSLNVHQVQYPVQEYVHRKPENIHASCLCHF